MYMNQCHILSFQQQIKSNFEEKEYTCYDYAYVVNMLYSDYGNIFTEPVYYLKMARNYLTDADYYGTASERAYHDAMLRIAYFKKYPAFLSPPTV